MDHLNTNRLEHRVCRTCGEPKVRDDFYRERAVCKSCARAEMKAYRSANHERLHAVRASRQRGSVPCVQCCVKFQQVKRSKYAFCSTRCRLYTHITVADADACWMWEAALDEAGYATLWVDGRGVHASRVMWELERGPIPAGLFALHRCDNPRCVNPNHLFLGTHADNMADMKQKKRGRGRVALGEDNHWAKLRTSDVIAIRESAAVGASLSYIARTYGVTQKAIRLIVNRTNWRHVA